MGNPVSLSKVNDRSEAGIKAAISNALSLIDFKFNNSAKTVVIKPNLCYYWGASTGSTTDPEIVRAIIDIVREKCGENVSIKIAEADASAMRTKYAFPVLGYTKLAEEKKVELLNLCEDELEETQITVNKQNITLKIPQSLIKADLFINVPKLKVMRATKITCAMKNLFGANGVPRKVKYHKILDETIVGINKILHPHLTVVDGIFALGSSPIKLNLILSSTDTFSIDWVVSEITGFNPTKVPFLKLAAKEKLGNPQGIIVKGESIANYRKIFPKPKGIASTYGFQLQSAVLNAYTKLAGDIVPPSLEE
jgi:uncharacterized protein (DUF362 family)